MVYRCGMEPTAAYQGEWLLTRLLQCWCTLSPLVLISSPPSLSSLSVCRRRRGGGPPPGPHHAGAPLPPLLPAWLRRRDLGAVLARAGRPAAPRGLRGAPRLLPPGPWGRCLAAGLRRGPGAGWLAGWLPLHTHQQRTDCVLSARPPAAGPGLAVAAAAHARGAGGAGRLGRLGAALAGPVAGEPPADHLFAGLLPAWRACCLGRQGACGVSCAAARAACARLAPPSLSPPCAPDNSHRRSSWTTPLVGLSP